MKLKSLLKIATISITILLGGVVGRFTSKKDLTDLEVMELHRKIEKRVEVLKEKIDSKFGDGFFQEMVMQRISDEETNKRKKLGTTRA